LYDIPVATNQATADFLISSSWMEEEYERKIIDFSKELLGRLDGNI
jgi:methylglyoxal synthase